MCLIALAWRVREDLPLVVAANRDEWRERPAQAAHYWKDAPRVFAGRDLKAGGTWMGVTRGGRFAAITNFRDPSDRRSDARSRGEIVGGYLATDAPPREFIAQLATRASQYNGFNLLLGDRESLWYFGSREGAAREVTPGVHALSNHLLDEPWPKVIRARLAMEAAIAGVDPFPKLLEAFSDSRGAPDGSLPDTGVGLDWERRLAPALIVGAEYGTRCSTVVAIGAAGLAFEELTRDESGAVVGRVREDIPLDR